MSTIRTEQAVAEAIQTAIEDDTDGFLTPPGNTVEETQEYLSDLADPELKLHLNGAELKLSLPGGDVFLIKVTKLVS